MLRPSVLGFNTSKLSSSPSSNTSMYLGKWRNQISDKINPRYYNNLFNTNSTRNYATISENLNSIRNQISFRSPLFSFSNSTNNGSISFSFISDKTRLTPIGFNNLIYNNLGLSEVFDLTSKFDEQSLRNVVEQQYYVPGYVLSNGNGSLGVSAVFVQSRFLDNTFNFLNLKGTSKYQLYNDKVFTNATRGTGYQVNLKQNILSNISVSIDYQSKINMNEFNLIGLRYSQKGDFDIPSQFDMSVEMPILSSNKIKLSAEQIAYGTIDSQVHSGYPDELLRIINSPISKVFKLENLIVYSAELSTKVNDNLSWNIGVVSRQQPSATTEQYTNIIKANTAKFSYNLGLKQKMNIGEFNIFASFANKPIILGTTDFGRQASNTLSNHIEGVMSWSISF